MKDKKEIITFFLGKNILVTKEIIEKLAAHDIDLDQLYRRIKDINHSEIVVLTEHINDFLEQQTAMKDVNWKEYDKSMVLAQKGDTTMRDQFTQYVEQAAAPAAAPPKVEPVQVLVTHKEQSKKWDVQDFVGYFNQRYSQIERILKNRTELQNLISINRIKMKKDKDTVSLIGMVYDKQTTKNGNLLLIVEDKTGQISVLVSKNKPELFAIAQDLVVDEIVGIVGTNGNKIVFAQSIVWPDVPETMDLKKAPEDGYAIFLSDLHVGSSYFLEEQMHKFIGWINGEVGSDEQREVAKNTKYIFIAGDLVDGSNIYPGQEKELVVKDIYDQYKVCAEWLKKIPPRIHLILCPGNHDAVRLSEPQPAFDPEISKPLFELPNATIVSNPSLVSIHGSDGFSGLTVALYHGYSFDYYVANVDSIRLNGGYDRGDLIMKFLLKRRHFGPSYTSTLYIPNVHKDALVIDPLPDFILTGHIHKLAIAQYKHITLICGSCWQDKTPFQEKVGHHPEPCRVPVVNLKTRDVKVMRF